MTTATSKHTIRVAVEGCGHGALDDIYASVEHSAKLKGWPGVDLLIICGDFQAVRNGQDLNTMSVPFKYRELGDFHHYYSGAKRAPYLTLFIGGNHEASAHCRELYYGGWVAPNIYYMGAANVLRLGPHLRIAGLSGIFKHGDYRKPHHERLPYGVWDVKSAYHVRDLDVRKLLAVRSQVDVGLSHDWPEGIVWLGNHRQLFQAKPYFRGDAENRSLGSWPAMRVLDRLRPPYWFSGHMHCKFVATKTFGAEERQEVAAATLKNEDEIDLDLDMDAEAEQADKKTDDAKQGDSKPSDKEDIIPAEILAQLPDSFKQDTSFVNTRQHQHQGLPPYQPLPQPAAIRNCTVNFLALDKILPRREFLQLLEITPSQEDVLPEEEPLRPLQLGYDPEWLAITRVFAKTNPATLHPPFPLSTPEELSAALDTELAWVNTHISSGSIASLTISPEGFIHTAPVHDEQKGRDIPDMPREYNNPQTVEFCRMVGIDNPFWADEEEQLARVRDAPEETRGILMAGPGGSSGRGRGSDRGRGRGRGRGGGFNQQQRGYRRGS